MRNGEERRSIPNNQYKLISVTVPPRNNFRKTHEAAIKMICDHLPEAAYPRILGSSITVEHQAEAANTRQVSI